MFFFQLYYTQVNRTKNVLFKHFLKKLIVHDGLWYEYAIKSHSSVHESSILLFWVERSIHLTTKQTIKTTTNDKDSCVLPAIWAEIDLVHSMSILSCIINKYRQLKYWSHGVKTINHVWYQIRSLSPEGGNNSFDNNYII
jgi:hypothetical protein